jgi:hypothetical protein
MYTAVSEAAGRRIARGDPDPRGVLMRNGSHGFWLCVAAAVAVIVVAVPAASAGVHKYDTRVAINYQVCKLDRFCMAGHVKSQIRKCERGRRVNVFKERPGADRRIGNDRSGRKGAWAVDVTTRVQRGARVYAKVTPKERYRFGCLADRSRTIRAVNPGR